MVEHKNDLSKYKAYNARYKLYDPFDGVASREKGATTATTTTAKATEDINNSNSTTTITVIYELQKICSTTVLIKSNINRKSNFVTIPTIKIAQ